MTTTSYIRGILSARPFGLFRLFLSLCSLLSFPLAVHGGGTVIGWGGNHVGESTPCATNVIAIAAGYEHSLLLKADGTVADCGMHYTYPSSPWDIPIIIPAGLSNVIAVSGGDSHSMALKTDGTVVVWGVNTHGQTNVPPNLTNVVAISAGAKHSLALKADGTVVGWGTSGTNVPAGLSNVVAIAAGRGNSLALKADGTVVGWGDSQNPAFVTLSNIVAIAAGDNGTTFGGYESWLALQADGVVVRGSSFGGTSFPASNAVAISASRGTDHHISLALMANGTVTPILGYNFYGGPNVPPGLTNVVAVAAGDQHDLALIGELSPFLLVNPAWDSNGFRVSVSTQSGHVYRLEYKDSLADSDWITLTLVAGGGGLQTLTDSSATGGQRFYRARRW